MNTPVALIIFNRSHTTERVFTEIAKAKPSKLLVVADGPREDHPGEAEKCAAARAIIERVDWDCEVLKNYSHVNLGCGRHPATGISWVFEQVDKAIILEDDCVPHPTFFQFCEELLEKFRDDERVMHIAGNNFQFGRKPTQYSYFFSFQNFCWGWATWRRAWKYFDIGLNLWPMFRDTLWLRNMGWNARGVEYYKKIFDRAYNSAGNIDYWDYQWTFACWAHNGLSVLPNKTLVSNIGCGPHATHTTNPNNVNANLPAEKMVFPLKHPPNLVRNIKADQFYLDSWFSQKGPNLYSTLRRGISAVIPDRVRKPISYLRSKWV